MDRVHEFQHVPEIQALLQQKPKKPMALLPKCKPEPGREEIKKRYNEWEATLLSLVKAQEDKLRRAQQKEVDQLRARKEARAREEERMRKEEERVRMEEERMQREAEEKAKEEERLRKEEERLLKEARREEAKKKKAEREQVKELRRQERGISKEEEEKENRVRRQALAIQREEKKEAEQNMFMERLRTLQKNEAKYTPSAFMTEVRQLLLSRQKTTSSSKSMIHMGVIGSIPFLTKWITTIIDHHQERIAFLYNHTIRGRKELLEECLQEGELEDAEYQRNILEKYGNIIAQLQKEVEELQLYKEEKEKEKQK